VALPVFRELMLKVYHDGIVGPAPAFPDQMEQRITQYLQSDVPALVVGAATSVDAPIAATSVAPGGAPRAHATPAELEWLLHHATVFGLIPTTKSPSLPLKPIRED
jgi:hypothetical protein